MVDFRLNMDTLRKHLEFISNFGKEDGMYGVGRIESFVLKHGYEFSGAIEIPKHVLKGEMKLCFGNAALMALEFREEFAYAEGL